MEKTYRIYRMENKKTSDVVFKFYLPEEGVDTKISLQRKAKRLKELYELKRDGYVTTADIFADKEDYLNARLSVAVSDYCELDHKERYVRIYRSRYTPEVYIKTLELVIESKRTAMKRIASLVRRIHDEDFKVHNGFALILYDRYVKEIVLEEV